MYVAELRYMYKEAVEVTSCIGRCMCICVSVYANMCLCVDVCMSASPCVFTHVGSLRSVAPNVKQQTASAMSERQVSDCGTKIRKLFPHHPWASESIQLLI